jgi:hypothetical protein
MPITLPTLYQQGKVCTKCGKEKPHSDYSKHKQQKSGLHPRCKECRKEEHRLARKQPGHQAKARVNHLRNKYGLTLEQYDAMLLAQAGLCKICGNAEAHHVDHCHQSGKVRGLLCINCNHGIGKFKDNPQLLRTAATYLEESK